MKQKIRGIVNYYVRRYDTRDPFEIAKILNVIVHVGNIGNQYGCYMYLKRHRCIFLSEDLTPLEREFVMAHELAHAIMHRKQNCYFLMNSTMLNSKIEREANVFAAELLITDDRKYEESQLVRARAYVDALIKLKI